MPAWGAQLPYSMRARAVGEFIGPPVSIMNSTLEVALDPRAPNAPKAKRAAIQITAYGVVGAILSSTRDALTDSEIANCFEITPGKCLIRRPIPLSLATLACSLLIETESPDIGVLAEPVRVQWGVCAEPMNSANPGNTDWSWAKTLEISETARNIGSIVRESLRQLHVAVQYKGEVGSVSADQMRVITLGYDQLGKIVWAASEEHQGGANEYSRGIPLRIEAYIFPWQWHRLCQLRMTVLPTYKQIAVAETDYLNNEWVTDVGLCEANPESNPAARADLAAWLSRSESKVGLHFINLGPVRAAQPGR